MIDLLVILIIVILVAGVGYWAVNRLAAAFGLPAPVVVVAQVIIVLAAVAILLERTGLLSRGTV